MFLFPESLLQDYPKSLIHCFKICNRSKLQAATLLKEAPWEMSNSEIFWNFDTGVQKNVICFLSDFAWNFFQQLWFSPLSILGVDFHTLWLQLLFHQKFPLLSYNRNTISVNDEDLKSSRGISS